jgi:Mrp family chromosome partitioning ATPase
MQSVRLSNLVEEVSQSFDWIVIDSPPILPLADTTVWARLADGIMLVTREGVTEKQQLQQGVRALDQTKLLGVILNSYSSGNHQNYYQRYGPASGPPNAQRKMPASALMSEDSLPRD